MRFEILFSSYFYMNACNKGHFIRKAWLYFYDPTFTITAAISKGGRNYKPSDFFFLSPPEIAKGWTSIFLLYFYYDWKVSSIFIEIKYRFITRLDKKVC